MYAIVNIAGQQFKVEKDQKLFVHRLENKEGDTVRFEEILLIDNDKNVLVGEPTINGAMITGKVLSHTKADKIKVFKKKRRKGYKVLNGHRQYLTEIQIQEIVEKGASKKAMPETAAKKTTARAPAKKTESDAKAAPEKKATTEKKATEEIKAAPVAKPATEKKPVAKKKAAEPKKETAKKTSGITSAKTATAKKSTGAGTKAAPKKPAADKKD